MPPHKTFPNIPWDLGDAEGNIPWERVPIAVLMDIRNELKQLNWLLSSPNVTSIPETLRRIQRNTAKKKPLNRKQAKQ